MHGFGRFSDGADGRRAVSPLTHHHHETPKASPRDNPADRDGWDAVASGRLRKDLAAFRAVQVDRIATRADAPPGRPGRREAKIAVLRPSAAECIEWTGALIALVPTRLILELAFPFGAAVALVMFWSTFGPSFVAAFMNQPVP